MGTPRFLTLDEVLHLHDLQLARFGGLDGIRDTGLLQMPEDAAYDLVIATADGRATKPQIAEAFREHAAPAR